MLKLRWKPGKLASKKTAVSLFLAGAVFFIFFWHLSSLTPGFSPTEKSFINSSQNFHEIINNPINAPLRVVTFGISKLHHAGLYRLPEAMLATCFIGLFYVTLKRLFGKQSAALTTALFISLPVLILVGRQATADILYLTPLLVMAAYSKVLKNPKKPWWLIFLLAACALSLYTPGMLYILLGLLFFSRQKLWAAHKTVGLKYKSLGAFIFLALVSPLIWSGVAGGLNFHDWLLIPHKFGGLVSSAAWSLSSLFVKARHHVDFIVGRQPLVDAMLSILVICGVYALATKARQKLYEVLAFIIFAVAIAALNNKVALLLYALPAIAVLVAAGLRNLYMSWSSVFPRNPVARSMAVILMLVLILVHFVYGIRYSLIAWPHSVDTKTVYVLK